MLLRENPCPEVLKGGGKQTWSIIGCLRCPSVVSLFVRERWLDDKNSRPVRAQTTFFWNPRPPVNVAYSQIDHLCFDR